MFDVSTIIQELESVNGNHCTQKPHGRVFLSKWNHIQLKNVDQLSMIIF